MQAFCYAEGTAAAYDMALRAAPGEAAFFEEATRASARFARATNMVRFRFVSSSFPVSADSARLSSSTATRWLDSCSSKVRPAASCSFFRPSASTARWPSR